MTDDEDRMIVAAAADDPTLTAKEIRSKLGLTVSVSTICEQLHEAGLRSRVPARKPMLSAENRHRRLLFAEEHSSWTVTDWQNVLFTDESAFTTRWDQRRRIWRADQTRYLYQPLVGGGRPKLLRCVGTVACFGFVCVWHKMTRAVQIWCALNALGISLEIVTTTIRGCQLCQKMEATYVHGFRLRVLRAVLGSGLYLLTIFACLFFLTNMQVATIFFHRVILGFPLPIVPVLVFLYFASHVSLDVMDWERVPREASHSRPLPSS